MWKKETKTRRERRGEDKEETKTRRERRGEDKDAPTGRPHAAMVSWATFPTSRSAEYAASSCSTRDAEGVVEPAFRVGLV